MKHTTRIPTALTVLAVPFALAACGGGDDASADGRDYCDTVTTFVDDHAKDMSKLDPKNTKVIREIADSFGTIAEASSGAVHDDWATLEDMYSKVADGKNPQSFSTKETGALQTSVQDITKQVKKECNIEF